MAATPPDFLRLLTVPALGWAALRDVRTRRVSNHFWIPLVGLGIVLLGWEGVTALRLGNYRWQIFLTRAVISIGFVVPFAYGAWELGGFGGADAKAFISIAILFPSYPTYYLDGVALPLVVAIIGVFSLTILVNTVLIGALYPVLLSIRNLFAGHRPSARSLLGRKISVADIPSTHGRLLENRAGFTRSGLDLDALRMYLRYRDIDLSDIRERPELRDPTTLPEDPNDPTDGAIQFDGGFDDPWGADRFLSDIDHNAYGTTPEQLREGLDVLAKKDEVWISPGIPFLVPAFLGCCIALTYGDLLIGIFKALSIG
ncbi:MAG: prepilin peptidase [Halobacteriaceae archaeon]